MVVGSAFGPAATEGSSAKRGNGMASFSRSDNLNTEQCDRRWTVAGWAVTSRVAGLLRLLDDSFSLPGVQPACVYT